MWEYSPLEEMVIILETCRGQTDIILNIYPLKLMKVLRRFWTFEGQQPPSTTFLFVSYCVQNKFLEKSEVNCIKEK